MASFSREWKGWRIVGTLLVVLILCFALSSSGISGEAFQNALRKYSPQEILFVFLMSFLQVFLMMLRLWFLVPRGLGLTGRQVFSAVAFGHAANMFLPARVGEGLKLVLLSRSENTRNRSMMFGLGVLLADRFVDLSALIAVVLVSRAFLLPQFPWNGDSFVYWVLGGVIALILLGMLLRRSLKNLLHRLLSLRTGFSQLLRPLRGGLAFSASVGVWVTEILAILWLASGQGLEMNWREVVVVLVVLNLAIAVPISVANVGPFEASIVFAMGLFDVGVAPAVAIAAIHHGLQLLAVASWPLILLLWGRLSRGTPVDFEPALKEAEQQSEFRARQLAEEVEFEKHSSEVKWVVENLSDPPAGLLDVGCGNGVISLAAKERGWKVFSVDGETAAAMRLSTVVDYTEVANVTYLELDQLFECVVCREDLNWAEDGLAAMKNILRYVAPGGRLLIIVNLEGKRTLLQSLEDRVLQRKPTQFSLPQLRGLAGEAGMEQTDTRPFGMGRLGIIYDRV